MELEKVWIFYKSLFLINIFIFKFDRAGAGKYTKEFGQFEMSFCYENEDVL
jgi:hypothetical protein